MSRSARPLSTADLALYLVGVAGMAAGITLGFLGMRSVMGVGGQCAEGGAYVIAHACPDGAAPSIMVGIFGGVAATGLVAWKGGALGGAFASVAILGWPALFGSLGWNFLEFGLGLHVLPDGTRMPGEVGAVICGVVFELMALPVALGFVGGLIGSLRGRATSPPESAPIAPFRQLTGARLTGARPFAAARPARSVPGGVTSGDTKRAEALAELDSVLRANLTRRVAEATLDDGSSGTSAAEASAAVGTIVDGLERLAALRASGSISEVEFSTAKARLLAAADQ